MGLRAELLESPMTGVTPAREGTALSKSEIAQDTVKTPPKVSWVCASWGSSRAANIQEETGGPHESRHVQGKFVCKQMWDILGDLQKYLRGTVQEAEVSVSRWW